MIKYNYLFGKDINLTKYNLGVIKQPKIKDFVENNLSMEQFYIPFIFSDILINNSPNPDDVIKIKNKIGDLTFLLFYMSEDNENAIELLKNFKKVLFMLYGTDNMSFTNKTITISDSIIIDNNNFSILCDIILEFLVIDKKQFVKKVKPKEEKSAILQRFEKLEQESLKKQKNKNKGFGILELCNIIIHNSNFTYEQVYNMTIYQIKNSYEVLMEKESYMTQQLYRISPKFEFKDDKKSFKHWSDKTRLNNSCVKI